MKKKKVWKIVGVALILFVVVGISYAYLRLRLEGQKIILVRVKDLEVEMDESSTEGIVLDHAVPMTEEKGSTSPAYKFTLSNTGKKTIEYVMYLDENKALQQECSDQQESPCESIPKELIHYQLKKDGNPVSGGTLSDLELRDDGSRGIIFNDSIDKEDQTFELNVWLDYGADNSVSGKYYFGRIRLEAAG